MSAWVVGEDAFLCVGIGGKVSAVGDDWVEIAGHRLPTRLGGGAGIRYLSTELPPEHDDSECDTRLTDAEFQAEEADKQLTAWRALIERRHWDDHEGPMRFCTDDLCRVVAA